MSFSGLDNKDIAKLLEVHQTVIFLLGELNAEIVKIQERLKKLEESKLKS